MTQEISLTAVLLAGGLGTRLRTVVSDRPKVLAEVCGRPFITYLLDELSKAWVSESVLATGYLAEQIEDCLGNSYGGMRIKYSREKERRGTGGAVRYALPAVSNPLVLVMNGDSFCEVDLNGFIKAHVESGAKVSMVVRKVDDTGRYGRVELSESHRVLAFEEKSGEKAGPGWINAGIYLFAREVLEAIHNEGEVSMEREVLPQRISLGVQGFCSSGRFIDIGLPDTLEEAQTFFANWERCAETIGCG
ncbi:MAG: nucleotidyltransferase family protein [Myxococcota bacterium]|nr:nucleotidyltransferase family protein [Myxococcota bacterium]